MSAPPEDSKPFNQEEFHNLAAQGMFAWEEWLGPDWSYQFISPACERLSGFHPQEFIKNPALFCERVHPEDRDRFTEHRCHLAKLSLGEMATLEYRLITRSGAAEWFSQKGEALRAVDGSLLGFHTCNTPISQIKQMEESLRINSQAVHALINVPTDIFALMDAQGRIVEANQTMATRVNHKVEEIIGRELWDLFPPEDAERRKALFDRVLKTGRPERVDDPGVYGSYDSTIYPVMDSKGQVIQVAVLARDVSEKHRAEAELRQAHENLERRVLERTAELEVTVRELRGENTRRIAAELEWQRYARRAELLARIAAQLTEKNELSELTQAICDELIKALPQYSVAAVGVYDQGTDMIEMLSTAPTTSPIAKAPPVPRHFYELLQEKFGTQVIIPDVRNIQGMKFDPLVSKNEVRTIISLPMYQDDELSGILTVVSIKDVHLPDQEELSLLMGVRYQARLALANAQLIQKLKTSQERLRMLSARLVEIQESERRFLARKLHDDIGQALTSLSFNLELIARNAHKVGALKGIVEPMGEIRDQVNGLLQMVRNLSLDLRPALLDDLGLLPALLDYFERFTIETGVRVNLKRSGLTERLDPQVETSVFRIFQEALQNVAHHAQTGAVDVLIWADAKMLGAKIQDAGMGFNVPVTELTARAGGLSRMSERVLSCGGQLEIESKPGRGTTLTLEIPLQPGNTTEEKT